MKKKLFNVLLCSLLVVPFMGIQADTIDEGQSTEGTDFWVTFMRADQNDHSDASDKAVTLALTVSAKVECDVTFTNPNTQETKSEHMTAGSIKEVAFYTGDAGETARTRTDAQKASITCYTYYPDSVDNCAIHVESTASISLFASNRRSKSFDATNVLPSASLRDEYLIQAVPPSDHGGSPQGTHFCIIATENNTVVDYCPTVELQCVQNAKSAYAFSGGVGMTPEEIALANWQIGDTLHTPTLNKGQVYYIWTGNYSGASADLSGTWLKARDNKKIAVFQGAPHTNLPDQIRDRDHLFSQAMPVAYWGNTFVITASMTRGRDIIRVMAREDGTELFINGDKKHTFNFASDPKRTFEFEIGESNVYCSDKNHKGNLSAPLVADSSCYITTSCPAATHLFMVSNTYDSKINDVESTGKGDPAMVWVNPIEQRINDITFATYGSSNTHYVNVVTDNAGVASMKLDGTDISADFSPVSGSNNKWYFARKNITYATHRLTGNEGFIAHVYGYGDKESYGYSAGGSTKPLSQSIYINGQEFTPDSENTLCGKDTVHFACKPDFMPDSIKWHFGDGSADVMVYDTTTIVPHYYNGTQDYNASCTIYRSSSNLCVGQSAETVINILVTIGRYTFTIGEAKIPCPVNGVQGPGTIPYTSSINLIGDTAVKVDFDTAAKEAGFTKNDLKIKPDQFELNIPATAEPGVKYGIQIEIHSDCGDTIAVLPFALPVGNDVIDQRYNNVLGLIKDHKSLKGLSLSDFQWYRASDSTALVGQVTSNLNMYDLPESDYKNDEFYICYWVNKGQADAYYNCACAKPFITDSTHYQFGTSPDSLIISASYSYQHGEKVFVNANWGGKTDIECYAQWITTDGRIYKDLKFNIPNGGCTIDTPAEPGLYMLRVVTEKKTRSFKFIIQ